MRPIFIFILSFHALSLSQKEGQKLVTNYLNALRNKDSKNLQKILSKNYYEKLKSSGYIKKILNKQKNNSQKLDFDFKIKKAANEKDVYFLNIKDKSHQKYNNTWYRVYKKKIDGIRYFD